MMVLLNQFLSIIVIPIVVLLLIHLLFHIVIMLQWPKCVCVWVCMTKLTLISLAFPKLNLSKTTTTKKTNKQVAWWLCYRLGWWTWENASFFSGSARSTLCPQQKMLSECFCGFQLPWPEGQTKGSEHRYNLTHPIPCPSTITKISVFSIKHDHKLNFLLSFGTYVGPPYVQMYNLTQSHWS